jgi:hypothetical protein
VRLCDVEEKCLVMENTSTILGAQVGTSYTQQFREKKTNRKSFTKGEVSSGHYVWSVFALRN